MPVENEIAALHRQERFREAGNTGADMVVYDILANWPPSRQLRTELSAKILRRYGDVLRSDQASGIVGTLIVQEMNRLNTARRAREEEAEKRRQRRRRI